MTRVGIVGASGYSGAELLRLLSLRQDVSIAAVVAGTSAGKRVDEIYPAFTGQVDLVFESFNPESLDGLDVVFVALPSGEGMRTVPQLMGRAGKIIDLGGDFRLPDASLYEQFYGHTHTAPELLGTAVYGLPELNRTQIESARLVANPGCYPTSAILPLAPLLQSGIVSPKGIVINSLSGVSGAGRTSSVEMSFAEVNENVRAYKVGRHQHIPEMQSVLERISGNPVALSFVPHLAPLTRGIYSTVHANVSDGVTEEDVYAVYAAFFRESPFVRVRKHAPQLRDVSYTNYCDIGFVIDQRTRQIIIMSVIDNLIKGAAGQAIQNMNIMTGIGEETGLMRREMQHV